ncbi:acyl-CoA thioesterase II [Kordiimonas sediminis]|uniref:Acyl-CoA thioesterase II n=1 Tax=Kordiimonas sediminis TaxID=1735581 RepID=A0A919E9C0_9PROT|nr:acyl-CoA thioesterase II [Kordiimonas sediminis]GHF26739.1 acyl-CoA thioesterase II [Kordiimonas sediminis]
MANTYNHLAKLAIEKLDTNLFRGQPNDWPNRHVFGGHVVAQAILAATETVDDHFYLHSLHCYFLRPGIAGQDLIYDVDPIRNGRSFCTRRVNAIQNGEAIFSISLSFHIKEEGLVHQPVMPVVALPDDLLDDDIYFNKLLRPKDGPPIDRKSFFPFETRALEHLDIENPEPKSSSTGFWFKLIETPDQTVALNAALLAYVSDMSFLSSTLRPHGLIPRHKRLKNVASLDHSIWLHETDFDLTDWVFYQTDGEWTGNGRGLARGRIFTHDGKHIASTSQEALIRLCQE